jgi:hypothetical protein
MTVSEGFTNHIPPVSPKSIKFLTGFAFFCQNTPHISRGVFDATPISSSPRDRHGVAADQSLRGPFWVTVPVLSLHSSSMAAASSIADSPITSAKLTVYVEPVEGELSILADLDVAALFSAVII